MEKKPKRESTGLFAAFGRIPPRTLIISCVAVAVIITFVSLFLNGNFSGNSQQAMAAYDTSKVSAPQISAAPYSASISTVPSAAPSAPPTVSDSSETGPLGSVVYQEGMSDPIVPFIQQRLMDLNYLDDAPTTELYGPLTQQAVMCFQRSAGLQADGSMGSETYTMLMSEYAPVYTVGLGAKGTDVEDMIYRLYELGYMNSSPDTFTEAVKTAVEKFQKMNGLTADGTIGESTREMLYSKNAKEYSTASSSQSSPTNVTGKITQKTNLKSAKLEGILPSALKGLGQALYDGEQQYKINSLFILSIINYESGNGTSNLAQTKNNLGGIKINGVYGSFASKEECIDYMYNLLSTKYIGRGLTTIPDIGLVYCGNDTWASVVTGAMQDLIAQCS